MRRITFFALALVVATSLSAGSVRKIGSLQTARYSRPTATLLPDGRVLVAGGTGTAATLEVVEVRGGIATSTLLADTTPVPLLAHTATALPDGRVLLVGGGYQTDGRPIFGFYGDRRVTAFQGNGLTPLPELQEWRSAHRSTLLAGGRVLVTGGNNVSVGGFHLYETFHSSAELIADGTRFTGAMHEARASHTATLLHDGRVLIAGGTNREEDAIATAEAFDPATETFSYVGAMEAARARHTATLLHDGRVLVAGGNFGSPLSAEIFDPATNTFTPAADVGSRDGGHTATLLPDGTVLIAGGSDSIVVYDPVRDAVVDEVQLESPLIRHAAVLLPDGSVLLIGGAENSTNDILRWTRNETPRRRAVRR